MTELSLQIIQDNSVMDDDLRLFMEECDMLQVRELERNAVQF